MAGCWPLPRSAAAVTPGPEEESELKETATQIRPAAPARR